jgi:hypothetical protein
MDTANERGASVLGPDSLAVFGRICNRREAAQDSKTGPIHAKGRNATVSNTKDKESVAVVRKRQVLANARCTLKRLRGTLVLDSFDSEVAPVGFLVAFLHEGRLRL